MKVKKIIAPTMGEAMKIIKQQLGSDAVILSSKEIKSGGLFGLFARKNIEVLAAIEYEQDVFKPRLEEKLPNEKSEHERPIFPDYKAIQEKEQLISEKEDKKEIFTPLNGIEVAATLAIPKKEENISEVKVSLSPQKEEHLVSEINELKALIQQLNTNVSTQKVDGRSPKMKEIRNILGGHGVAEHHITNIISYASEENRKVKGRSIGKLLEMSLKKQLENVNFGAIDYNYKYIGLVGPTGVGKTTTLAKLAADAILNHNKKIAFITTDTYRIGAVDQLKRYATVLGVPVEVCYNPDDFKEAKRKLQSYDLVFIDTSGRNYREKKYVDELTELITSKELHWSLVFSLSAKPEDVHAMYNQFRAVPINSFIFTKFDETTTYGTMLNVVLDSKIGVSYLTNGQDVPDDILAFDETQLISLFTKEGSFQ